MAQGAWPARLLRWLRQSAAWRVEAVTASQDLFSSVKRRGPPACSPDSPPDLRSTYIGVESQLTRGWKRVPNPTALRHARMRPLPLVGVLLAIVGVALAGAPLSTPELPRISET